MLHAVSYKCRMLYATSVACCTLQVCMLYATSVHAARYNCACCTLQVCMLYVTSVAVLIVAHLRSILLLFIKTNVEMLLL